MRTASRAASAGVRAAVISALIVVALLMAGMVIGGGAAEAAEAAEEACTRVPTAGNGGEAISMCSSLVTHEQPRWARSDGRVMATAKATSATGCRLTSWVDLSDATGHSWASKRASSDCSWALGLPGGWRFVTGEVVGTQAGVRARGHVCVDLYFGGSTHSGWQRCAPPTAWRPLGAPPAVEAPPTPKPEVAPPYYGPNGHTSLPRR